MRIAKFNCENQVVLDLFAGDCFYTKILKIKNKKFVLLLIKKKNNNFLLENLVMISEHSNQFETNISCCTSAKVPVITDVPAPRFLFLSNEIFFAGVFNKDRFDATDKSAVTRVIMILPSNFCFKKSKIAFCIISVTSKPFNEGPTITTGLIEGTTS